MIFIDAGYYYGAATQLMEPADDWIVHGFESNPEIETPPWVSNEAVWIHDGTVSFKLNRDRNDASTMEAGVGQYDTIEVPCIDFSRFLGTLSGTVICSMDIEGAEFKVLERCLKEGTAAKLTVLDIEFHHRLMNDYDMHDARKLIKQLRKQGVIVCLKIPLE